MSVTKYKYGKGYTIYFDVFHIIIRTEFINNFILNFEYDIFVRLLARNDF